MAVEGLCLSLYTSSWGSGFESGPESDPDPAICACVHHKTSSTALSLSFTVVQASSAAFLAKSLSSFTTNEQRICYCSEFVIKLEIGCGATGGGSIFINESCG